MEARGWDAVDVVLVSGDAYVDHPSFANGLIARLLEAAGFRVAVLAQPDWQSCEPWWQFGRPRLFFGISAGNMDSMINHYTANRKVRNDDAYSPNGEIGRRPDRATFAYCQRSREAFPGVPVVAGGVEASLRRIAHYDYWSDTVRRSILMDSKANFVAFGMGERTVLEIARGLAAGKSLAELRDLRGMAYRLGTSEPPPTGSGPCCPGTIELPDYESVVKDPLAFCEMTRISYLETNPHNARRLVQRHGREAVVLNLMKKPSADDYVEFDKAFKAASRRVGKKQYTVPYFIASHPGSGVEEMIDLALFLKRNSYKPDQVQDFIPSPFDIAACMYHTGLDPMTKQPVKITKGLKDRRMQRALLQFFKPENYFEVRRALEQAGRQDLIGSGCDCLISERPPQEALDRKRREATQAFTESTSGDHIRGGPGGERGSRKQRRRHQAATAGETPAARRRSSV
jgi:radical SAM superfamily enzyme YgiQ (UPF0313 family)